MNHELNELISEQKIYLVKIIGAIISKIENINKEGDKTYFECVDYIEFDSDTGSGQQDNTMFNNQTIIGVIPISNIYAVYGMYEENKQDQLLGYYIEDEYTKSIDWIKLYNNSIKK